MTDIDNCSVYLVKVSLNINLILFICVIFPLSSFLLLSLPRIVIFICLISSILARNYQHSSLSKRQRKKNRQAKNN